MEKINRLGWASGVCLQAYGLNIGVRFNTNDVPVECLSALPPGWKPARPPFVDDILYSVRLGKSQAGEQVRQYHLVYRGLTRIVRSMDMREVWHELERDIQHFIAEYSRKCVFVHAGVVGWDSQAIVIPGVSFAGKSTLTAALVRAGAEYYSDEFAVLDDRGWVHPFPRRMSLRQDKENYPHRVAADALGSSAGQEPLPVGKILLASYREGKDWQPRSYSAGKGVMEVLRHAVPAKHIPEKTIHALTHMVDGAKILKGQRGDASELVHILLQKAAA